MTIDDYILQLSLMNSWFEIYTNENAMYYEFTMRSLIVSYTYKQLLGKLTISENVEHNVIRLIEDTKIFIKEHLCKLGFIKNTYDIIHNYGSD